MNITPNITTMFLHPPVQQPLPSAENILLDGINLIHAMSTVDLHYALGLKSYFERFGIGPIKFSFGLATQCFIYRVEHAKRTTNDPILECDDPDVNVDAFIAALINARNSGDVPPHPSSIVSRLIFNIPEDWIEELNKVHTQWLIQLQEVRKVCNGASLPVVALASHMSIRVDGYTTQPGFGPFVRPVLDQIVIDFIYGCIDARQKEGNKAKGADEWLGVAGEA